MDRITLPATLVPAPSSDGRTPHWTLDWIDFSRIQIETVHDNDDLFYLLVSASFVESGSGTYTRNLVAHFDAYPQIADWLQHQWEPEELQHGRALRTYVQTVWPEFDWQTAYAAFFADYSRLCTVDELEDDRALELVARCVVETGTATYYQTLRDLIAEPILNELAERIRLDEVQHYKHFYRYFRQLNAERALSRARIFGALKRRLNELRTSDSDIALRYVWAFRHAPGEADEVPFEQVCQRLYRRVGALLPMEQAVKMLLRPLALPHRMEHVIERPLARIARKVMAG
ncbi:MAG: ferritin-like domain-containing protein [Thiomonas sp.]|nr:ferritin-like domain-containing protein [Thiomonas sp.]